MTAAQQPEKHRTAQQTGDGAHGKFGRRYHGPRQCVRQNQKGRAQQQGAGQDDAQVFAEHQPHRVGYDQPYKTDGSAGGDGHADDQGAQRVLQQSRPGVLFSDLNACNAYQNALAAAAQVKVPTTFVLGERDMMTPPKAGKTLAAATPNARTVVLPGAGHMMMVEAPDELLAALR